MSYPAAQLASSVPVVLICDNIRDPGNLGTVLRSAAGAGCEKVLLTKGESLSLGEKVLSVTNVGEGRCLKMLVHGVSKQCQAQTGFTVGSTF